MRSAPAHTALAVALAATLLGAPSPAAAADALGLDLSSGDAGKDAALGLDLSEKFEGDFTVGARVVAIPPLRADGRPDLAAYKLLHEALAFRLGGRFVAEDAALKAVEDSKLRGQALLTSEGITKVAVAVKAPKVLVFTFEKGKLSAVALAKPSAAPMRQSTWAWTKKTDLALVKGWVDLFLLANKDVLLPPPQPKQEAVVVQVKQEGVGDTDDEANREAARAQQEAVTKRPMLVVLVGAGATLRDFAASTERPIVPQAQGPMTGMGFDVTLYPLRMIPGMKDVLGGKLDDFSLEGHYRRTFANGRFAGTDPTLPPACSVEDDEALARAAWRYDFGGYWPRIGVSFGFAWERALMKCEAPVLSTRYRSTELHLKILQPIVGEQLQLELAGGPRFLVSTRVAGNADSAFSAEAWIVGRPLDWFFLRGGGRWTNTHLRMYPENIKVTDNRYFVGLEVGAAM